MVHNRLNSMVKAVLLSILGASVIACLAPMSAMAVTSARAMPLTSYCQTSTGFKSCVQKSGSTVSATGSASGICAVYPAHEQLTGPGVNDNTPSHSHWCGSTLSLGTTGSSGTWCGTLWEGPNGSGNYTRLAEACHTY
jgi:hypothetical protein